MNVGPTCMPPLTTHAVPWLPTTHAVPWPPFLSSPPPILDHALLPPTTPTSHHYLPTTPTILDPTSHTPYQCLTLHTNVSHSTSHTLYAPHPISHTSHPTCYFPSPHFHTPDQFLATTPTSYNPLLTPHTKPTSHLPHSLYKLHV